MGKYHLVTLLRGLGGTANPQLPQTRDQLSAWADQAARRVRSVEAVYLGVDGVEARVLDASSRPPRAFVKIPGSPPTTRVVPIAEGELGNDGSPGWVGALMPRLAPRETIPIRFEHRDEWLAGRYLDVWVNPNDPLEVLAYVGLEDTAAGEALQQLLEGAGGRPMAGFSIEVDPVAGEPFPSELTGGVFTAHPRLVASQQQVQVTEEVAGKGGSDYGFDNTALAMPTDETVAMNTEISAVENSEKLELNAGADTHSEPVPKRAKHLDGLAMRAEAQAKRLTAENDVLQARLAIAKDRKDKSELFAALRARAARLPEERRAEAEHSLDIVEKINRGDAEIVDMRIANPNVVSKAMGDFAHQTADYEELLAEKARMEREFAEKREAEAAAREAEKAAILDRKEQAAMQALGVYGQRRNEYSFGASSSSSSTIPAALAPTSATEAPGTTTSKRQSDMDAHFMSTLGASMAVGADYSFGSTPHFELDLDRKIFELACKLKDKVPLSMFVPMMEGGRVKRNARKRGDD